MTPGGVNLPDCGRDAPAAIWRCTEYCTVWKWSYGSPSEHTHVYCPQCGQEFVYWVHQDRLEIKEVRNASH